jgi:hypothetical protein
VYGKHEMDVVQYYDRKTEQYYELSNLQSYHCMWTGSMKHGKYVDGFDLVRNVHYLTALLLKIPT